MTWINVSCCYLSCYVQIKLLYDSSDWKNKDGFFHKYHIAASGEVVERRQKRLMLIIYIKLDELTDPYMGYEYKFYSN